MNLEQQRAHYKAVRARILTGARPPAPEPELPRPPAPLKRVPLLVADETRDSLRHILTAYDVTWEDVISPSRRHAMHAPRLAVYWALHCRGFSTSKIGQLTRRDHSSIVYALEKVNPWNRKLSLKRLQRLSQKEASIMGVSNRTLNAPPPLPA